VRDVAGGMALLRPGSTTWLNDLDRCH